MTKSCCKPLIYLASPYTHPSRKRQAHRCKEVCQIAAYWRQYNYYIYCPIAETALITTYGKLQHTDWAYWRDEDLVKLDHCDILWVALMQGWSQSQGVRGEIKFAIQNKKPIFLVDGFETVTETTYSNLLKLLNVTDVQELND